MPWNNQAPYRMTFAGSFEHTPSIVTFPTTPSEPAVYVATSTGFEWTGTFGFGVEIYNWSFVQLQFTDRPIVGFQLVILDLEDSFYKATWEWTLGNYPWGTVDFMHDPLPYEEEVNGLFVPGSLFGQARPVPYHDEP
jgi:hypothetical protein